jgi:TRAP-type C4-dicarboxylate transport system substrate-binding protein
LAKHVNRWAEKLAEASNGLLTIRHYPIATLIAPPDFRPAIKQGIADIGLAPPYVWDEKFTLGYHIPTLLWAEDTATVMKIYDDIWKEFPDIMAAEWVDYKVLWLGPNQPTCLGTADRPIHSMEDLKGLQMRAPSKGEADKLKLLGATPVTLSPPDFVLGLEKGTVDGGCLMWSFMNDFKLGGKIKYYTPYALGIGCPWFCVMNKDSWNNLHPDFQKIIDDTLEWGKQDVLDTWVAGEEEGIAYMRSYGVDITYLSDAEKARWDATLAPVFEAVAADMNDKGLPGTEFVQFVLERNAYYAAQ